MQSKRVLLAVIGAFTFLGAAQAFGQQPSVTTETYGNWIYRCTQLPSPPEQDPVVATEAAEGAAAKTANTESAGKMVCETSQVLQDAEGNVIAQIAFGIDPAATDKIVAAFQVPQGTLLSSPVRLGTEGLKQSIEAEYVTCYQSICLARAEINKDNLAKFSAVDKGTLEFADRSGRKINVLLSFDGLSAASKRLISGK
ncbi:MAG: invasion associated locus B family protein [Hoeflea sp.]|uniref:invasion associated locus B family protein n=1 Tax=Hoeflea sp. TaxID=1940281 RepID=UPI003EF3B55D